MRALPPSTSAVFLAASLLVPGALAQTPSADGEARFSTGLMHMREGRFDLALDEFKKAVKADPKNPYFQKGLGQAYAAKRKWDDAADSFRKALELNPYYVDVRNDLGMALILGGNREAGKKEFLTAFGDPTNPTPEISARNLGQVYFEEKNYAESASWYRTSLNRNKSYGEAYLGLADALAASGRPEEALLQLEAGVKEAPDDAVLVLTLGNTYLKAGRFSDARARLEDVVRKDPTGPAGRRATALLKEVPQ
jgi:Tfp pilus assembly protein PilF